MSVIRDQPIEGIEGEIFKVRVETEHRTEKYGTIRACTAVHDQLFARRIGGVRFVPGPPPSDRIELGELAMAMTWKCALAGLPADGEKTVVYCSGVERTEDLPTPEDAAAILDQHLKVLTEADPGVIFGPDIHCGEDVMTMLAHQYGWGDHVSGLKEGQGGLSIDGHGYTARGLEAALVATAEKLGWELRGMRASVQGFGAVGAHTASNLAKHGVVIAAVSTAWGALVATGPEGLPVEALFRYWQEGGDEIFRSYQRTPPEGSRWGQREEVFTVPAEIFVPAARTDVIATAEEIAKDFPGATDVVHFFEATGVKLILEGANHPLSEEAEIYVQARGVYVLPDYVVNCGGLVGCWTDWAFREELTGVENKAWEERLDVVAPEQVSSAILRNVPQVLASIRANSEGLREACLRLASSSRRELHRLYRSSRLFARQCLWMAQANRGEAGSRPTLGSDTHTLVG